MYNFSLIDTVDLFRIENPSNNQAMNENSIEVNNVKSSNILMSYEVICGSSLDDDEQVVGDGTKNGKNRLSMDSRVSVECAPSTSNIPVTPRIDSDIEQNDMEFHDENIDCETFIKTEDEDSLPTSVESEITVKNEDSFKSQSGDLRVKRCLEPVDSSIESSIESAAKRKRINQEVHASSNGECSNEQTTNMLEHFFFTAVRRRKSVRLPPLLTDKKINKISFFRHPIESQRSKNHVCMFLLPQNCRIQWAAER